MDFSGNLKRWRGWFRPCKGVLRSLISSRDSNFFSLATPRVEDGGRFGATKEARNGGGRGNFGFYGGWPKLEGEREGRRKVEEERE